MKRRGNYKHGMSNHPLNNTYNNIIRRCYAPTFKAYSYYGGRGITVCDEWRSDKVKFFEWAISNGWRRDLQIDRIDNNKGYSPDNCRIITHGVNMMNRRCTKKLEYKGIVRTYIDWSRILCVNISLIRDRVKAGKDIEYILFEPKHKNKYV